MIAKHRLVPGALLGVLAGIFIAQVGTVNARGEGQQTIQMTTVAANVDRTIDAKKAKAGDPFSAKTVTGTTLNDGTNVPAGSVLEGHIDSVTPSHHKSDSSMVITIDKVKLKDGKEIPVKATIASVATFERAFGGGSDHSEDRAFDTSAKDTARMNGVSNDQNAPSGPHSVPGLTLTSSVNDSNSGTLTQAKENVHLSNENQIQVSLAVVPAGVKVR